MKWYNKIIGHINFIEIIKHIANKDNISLKINTLKYYMISRKQTEKSWYAKENDQKEKKVGFETADEAIKVMTQSLEEYIA